MGKELSVAVLMPTYDELGVTIDRSIGNLARRMGERPDINWSLHIGVNGTSKREEVAKVRALADSHHEAFDGIPVEVHHYTKSGKERAMNLLAQGARRGQPPDMHIATDLKVYRAPGSLGALIDIFTPAMEQDRNPRYLGGTILPYPIKTYEKYFPLSEEQRLFYTLLEIDKDDDVRKIFPKSHLRGGLYVTSKWHNLVTDIADDFSITRIARKDNGNDAVQLTEEAKGYVIPRQSFADFFTVRLKRTALHLKTLESNYPELRGLKQIVIPSEEKQRRLDLLKDVHPDKYALYMTKMKLEEHIDLIAKDMQSAEKYIQKIKEEISGGVTSEIIDINLEKVLSIAKKDPDLAAKKIIYHYRAIIEALVVDPESINYGPREERYRGMLPLDEE